LSGAKILDWLIIGLEGRHGWSEEEFYAYFLLTKKLLLLAVRGE
jgi:hypothetical protein